MKLQICKLMNPCTLIAKTKQNPRIWLLMLFAGLSRILHLHLENLKLGQENGFSFGIKFVE